MSVEKEKCFLLSSLLDLRLRCLPPLHWLFLTPLLVDDSHRGWPSHVDGRQASKFDDLLTINYSKKRFFFWWDFCVVFLDLALITCFLFARCFLITLH